MDIRGKRLKTSSDRVTEFISSIGFDAPIADDVLAINMAHMLSLVKSGTVPRKAGVGCLRFLRKATPSLTHGRGLEDIHQAIEQQAVSTLGVETAGYLNLGKSRNDQVACAIRMELRGRIIDVSNALVSLQGSVVGLVRRHGKIEIPGYTHLQHAQPVTIAHHFIAYIDAFQRNAARFMELYQRVNLSPMGAAALAGTSVPVDRDDIASLLGFGGIVENAMDAVSSRDFVVEALSDAEMMMLDLSRLAEELVLWSTKEFGFVEVADEYAASSSIMPQKKNAVAAEMVRAKCGSVIGHLQAVCNILKALPYSYNLDLQEATPHLWSGLSDTVSSLEVMGGMLATVRFNTRAIRQDMENDYSTATSLANHLVTSSKVSFREAHAIVGGLVRKAVEGEAPLEEIAARYLQEVSAKITGNAIKISREEIEEVLDPTNSLGSITTKGGANPQFIANELERRLARIKSSKAQVEKMESELKLASDRLRRRVDVVLAEVKS